MLCPGCGSDQVVVSNSRPTARGTQVWRRRKCLRCNFLFTTHEKIDLGHITVIKKSGKRVRYIGAKLYSGIYHAVVGEKKIDRGDAGVKAKEITDRVEEELILSGRKELSTTELGDKVLQKMAEENTGAWLRYMAYFKVDGKKGAPRIVRRYLVKSNK